MIPEMSFRYQPVLPLQALSKKLFNILAARVNKQRHMLKSQKFGSDRADYLLFGEIARQSFDRHLREACFEGNTKFRTSHCLRHTYATELSGQFHSNTRLARMILGHTRQETTERYDHLFGLLNKTASVQQMIEHEGDIALEDFPHPRRTSSDGRDRPGAGSERIPFGAQVTLYSRHEARPIPKSLMHKQFTFFHVRNPYSDQLLS